MSGLNDVFTDLDAERAVIGAAMIDADAAKMVAELPGGTFSDQQHVLAHAAIRSLVNENKAVDSMTTAAKAKEKGYELDDLYLVDCTDKCPVVGNVKHYIGIIEKCAVRRRLVKYAKELLEKAGDATQEPDEAREWGARALRDIRTTGESDRLIPMSEAAGKPSNS